MPCWRTPSAVLRAVTRLLGLLAARDRVSLVSEILVAFQARVQERLQIVRAEVTTAVALPDDRREAIARRLGEVTGKQVSIDARVDPSIIGGVVAKDRQYRVRRQCGPSVGAAA